MGEGSFGQVFEGSLGTPAGTQRIVLKRVKTRVQGAEAMSQMEHLLNVYASRVARGHCAEFLGYCEVADSEANGRLTPGLWLVWKYEGKNTLSYYISRRDMLRALSADMQVPEPAVVPTVMKHIFEGLAAFHAAGLVHRDIKPLNIIFAEDSRRFKLIDLGACADLRSGTNYVPEESILDLNYCPPEQFVMPTDSPHIAKQGLLKLAISPMLWAKHKPDRFDTWSAGMVMLQLSIPCLRTDRALRAFNEVYGPKYSYDLAAWRKGVRLTQRDAALLDADDGAGWELLQSLLAPRHIQVDDGGGVSFVNDSPFPRISAYEALKHRFIRLGAEGGAAAATPAAAPSRLAAQPAAAAAASGSGRGGAAAEAPVAALRGGRSGGSAAGGGSSGAGAGSGAGSPPPGSGPQGGSDPLSSAMSLWRDMTGKLFDLEAKILRQASATELQTTTVKRLKEQVDAGKADPAVLRQEEKVLGKMQARLAGLQQDFTSTASQASGLLSFFGLGRKPAQQEQKQQAAQAPPQPQGADSGLPPGFRGSKDRSKASLDALRAAGAASASAAASPSNPAPSAPSSPAGVFSSMWEALSSGLGDLETKLSNQASATERQSQVVRGLRAKVQAGEAEPELLNKAERTLSRMERRLLALDRDYRAAKQSASGALAGTAPPDLDAGRGRAAGRSRGGSQGQSAGAQTAAEAPLSSGGGSGSDSEATGSFWSRLLGTPSRSRSGSVSGSMDGGSGPEAGPAPAQEPARPAQQPRPPSPFFRRAAPAPAPQQPQDASRLLVPPQQAQQLPQQPVYRSIFGAFGGGGSSGRSASPARGAAASTPAAAAAPPASTSGNAPAPQAPARSVSPRSAGLFKTIFGRPAAPQPEPKQQQLQPPAAQQRGAAAAPPPSPSSSVPPPPEPALPAAGSGGGESLVEGANRVIRSSLGFTGLAAKIAGDLASALKADAERYLKEMEAQEAAKRQQRTLELAFMALLREAQPPVASATSYDEAEARFGGEARWAALADEGRRRQLYGSFLQAARKVEEQAAAAADAGFRAALRRYDVSAGSSWEDFSASLPDSDPALAAVQDPARRQRLFLEVVAELQLQAALAEAARKAELEFTALLAELRDPPVTATSTWSLVRKAVAADPRCQALAERRRRELFEAYTAHLFEAEARRAEEAAAAASDEAEVGEAEPLAAAAQVAPSMSAEPVPLAAANGAAAAAQPQLSFPGATPSQSADARAGPAPLASHEAAAPAPADSSPAPVAAAGGGLDDDELAAALEGMEAALQSAIKAVAAAPLPSAAMLGQAAPPGSAGPSAASQQAGRAGQAANGKPLASPAGSGAVRLGGTAFDGSRLEELRREQARLRAEYEAMAQRLREMEERLRSQAQLITAPGDSDAAEPPLQPLGPDVGAASDAIGAELPAADMVASTNGVPAPARGRPWR